MENLLHEDFRGVKSKNSSDEALRRWRDVCGFVKNPKRRFRFTANLDKRGEAAAMRRTNQVSIFLFIFYSSMTCCWIAPMIF
jgi:Ca2+-transporting ATPase